MQIFLFEVWLPIFKADISGEAFLRGATIPTAAAAFKLFLAKSV